MLFIKLSGNPNLAAKPIIDILIGVDSLDRASIPYWHIRIKKAVMSWNYWIRRKLGEEK